jgi:hypothetical protein
MHRSRAPSIAPGTFFVAQSWADRITNMPGFNLRQAQLRITALMMGAYEKGSSQDAVQPNEAAVAQPETADSNTTAPAANAGDDQGPTTD